MLKLENTEIVGWEHAIRGMRNPKNSWAKSDSVFTPHELEDWPHDTVKTFDDLGPNDYTLMSQLAEGGPVHAKYRRMIAVYVDITAPLYWWKEFDTYKVGTVANSCSTMHKIASKEFTLDDFSCEHLMTTMTHVAAIDVDGNTCYYSPMGQLNQTIQMLNYFRLCYLDMVSQKVPNAAEKAKEYWWQMIQLLPSSYNQKRTIMLNYEVLVGIYKWRRNHKLDEWHTFCDWIEELPYSELITGRKDED